jgi:hypothetical protein
LNSWATKASTEPFFSISLFNNKVFRDGYIEIKFFMPDGGLFTSHYLPLTYFGRLITIFRSTGFLLWNVQLFTLMHIAKAVWLENP